MTRNRSTVFFTFVALVTLIAGAALAFGSMGRSVSFAHGASPHHRVRRKGKGSSGSPVSAGPADFSTPGIDPWGTAFDRHGNVWVALPGCDPSPACPAGTPPGKIAEFSPATNSWTKVYQLPAGFGQPLFLAFDRSGNLWFPMLTSNSLGLLTLSTGSFSQWTVPTADAGPWDIAIDGNGTIWLTEHFVNKIAAFNPTTHQFTEIATPATNSQPYGITIDHANNVWFTENNPAVALIAEYTTQGRLNEYRIRNGSTANLTPHLITVDGSGNLWWSEGWASSLGELHVAAAVPGTNAGVTEYTYHGSCATCSSHTSGIAVDQHGVVWFTDSLQSIYGSFNGSFTLYKTPTPNSHPHDGLNVDGQNHIWFTEEFANKLARI